jgi:hypothetical protein
LKCKFSENVALQDLTPSEPIGALVRFTLS